MTTSPAPLLVPTAAEALVVNSAVANRPGGWQRSQLNYDLLAEFSPPTSSPNDLGTPAHGIHLRWTLPRALTRGTNVVARASATIFNGAITAVTVDDGGYGYEVAPLIEFSAGGGKGAIAVASITDGVVDTITVIAGGSGFTEEPTVLIAASPAAQFPLIPNRWLVVRYGPATTRIAKRCFFGRSDLATLPSPPMHLG